MKFSTIATIALSLTLAAAPRPVLAQRAGNDLAISVDLQDAPVRSTLEAIFKQAGLKNYIIDNAVAGFVTLKISDQPFESALKLVMRASSLPLTYTKENGVLVVKPRTVPAASSATSEPISSEPASTTERYERLNLTYLDPADLAGILPGIITIPQFTRQRGGQGVSSGNGLLGHGGGQTGQLGQGGQFGSGSGLGPLGGRGLFGQGGGQQRRR
ncbi:MAG: hypothetical protein NTX57_05540 [Armatimonadetes bacterium]|nr:hypothetical protein [Armatimonadota bacterium]